MANYKDQFIGQKAKNLRDLAINKVNEVQALLVSTINKLGLALINIKTIYIKRLPLIFNRKSARKWIFLSKNLVFLFVILGE